MDKLLELLQANSSRSAEELAIALGTTTVLFLHDLGFAKSQIGFLLGMIPLVGVISPLIALT